MIVADPKYNARENDEEALISSYVAKVRVVRYMCCALCVMCHVSCVMWYVSCVMCCALCVVCCVSCVMWYVLCAVCYLKYVLCVSNGPPGSHI